MRPATGDIQLRSTAMTTDPAPSEALLVPIGHQLGAFYPKPDGDEHEHQLRVGAEVVVLDDLEFSVWSLGHGIPDDTLATAPWSRAQLLAAATEAGHGDVSAAVKGLLDRGALAEVEPDTGDDFARRFRLVPTMLGLGNSPEEPWLYGIGLLGSPMLKVHSVLYDLWQWSHLDNNIWNGCLSSAATARRVGITDPEQSEPDQLLRGLLRALHGFLSVRAAYVDRALAGASGT